MRRVQKRKRKKKEYFFTPEVTLSLRRSLGPSEGEGRLISAVGVVGDEQVEAEWQ
jgi:hypothetical protein